MNKRLASLLFYNETLYVNPAKNVEIEKETFKTDKHVLVLSGKLNEKEAQFLGKVLGAVKLTLQEVATLHEAISLSDLVALENVKYVLTFGDFISSNTLTVGSYKPALLDHKVFLFADPVAVIAKNENAEKTKLWNALKEIFFS